MQTEILPRTDEEDQERLTRAIQWVLADGHGRMLLRRILNLCGLRSEAAADPDSRAYHDGRQSVGMLLENVLEIHDPEGFDAMQREWRQERQMARDAEARRLARKREEFGQESTTP